jgi:hypothetical protein
MSHQNGEKYWQKKNGDKLFLQNDFLDETSPADGLTLK